MQIININGTKINVKKFATLNAAKNHIAKKGGELVFSRAHEYYVSV